MGVIVLPCSPAQLGKLRAEPLMNSKTEAGLVETSALSYNGMGS